MKVYLIILVLLLKINMSWAQRLVDNENFSIGSSWASRGVLLVKIDSRAKWTWFQYLTANQPLTSYIFTEGAKNISIDLYIPQDSIAFYRYSVIENGNKWLALNATPDSKLKTKEVKLPMSMSLFANYSRYGRVHLGDFSIRPGTNIIEYYKTTEPTKISTAIIYNGPIAPATILSADLVGINNNQQPTHHIVPFETGKVLVLNQEDTTQIRKINIFIKEPEQPSIYQVYLTNKKTQQSNRIANNWFQTMDGKQVRITIDADYLQKASDYTISIVPELSSGSVRRTFDSLAQKIDIKVLTAPHRYLLKDVIRLIFVSILILALIAVAAIFIIKKRIANRKTNKEMENELVRVKLNLIRSQLNPHFMFNALNGIQSLINNHKLEEANNYLVKFARLTRKILNHDDFVTINDEVVLLTDYLQMEQLRFHFQFSVKVDPADLGDVKIPAMLIQPFVENSVRHGVSELRTNGLIKIDIKKDFDNLNISIADNGTGFDIANKENGQGSRLMDDRISLLNNIQNETFIEAHLKSDISGTVVSLTLQKWLK